MLEYFVAYQLTQCSVKGGYTVNNNNRFIIALVAETVTVQKVSVTIVYSLFVYVYVYACMDVCGGVCVQVHACVCVCAINGGIFYFMLYSGRKC